MSIINDVCGSKSANTIDRAYLAYRKRLLKANKLAKQIAHGGWGEKAKIEYLTKYPEAEQR